jgi:hypothetical protein
MLGVVYIFSFLFSLYSIYTSQGVLFFFIIRKRYCIPTFVNQRRKRGKVTSRVGGFVGSDRSHLKVQGPCMAKTQERRSTTHPKASANLGVSIGFHGAHRYLNTQAQTDAGRKTASRGLQCNVKEHIDAWNSNEWMDLWMQPICH